MALPVVHTFVDAGGVVEHGEKLDDFDVSTCGLRKPQAVFENPCPMPDPMRAVPRQGVIFKDRVDDGLEIRHFPNVLWVPSQ